VEKQRKRWWCKYSFEFKKTAVDRLNSGESGAALSLELGIRRKFLYQWRASGFGSQKIEVSGQPSIEPEAVDQQQQSLNKLQKQVAELERLTGRQAAELDFFAAALRAVRQPYQKTGESSASGSTRRSKV
jgi:transposase-like protein